MPTETQHLEQRVAALQSDLNARDQALGDAETENNECELSRRDWFEAAQAAESRIEVLKGLLTDAMKAWEAAQFGDPPVALSKVMARARTVLATAVEGEIPSLQLETLAKEIYESWASQPGFTPWVYGGNSLKQDEARKAARVQLSEPVERDERADFLAWACREYEVGAEEELNERNVVVIQNWAGWKARAALDKATEGASHE